MCPGFRPNRRADDAVRGRDALPRSAPQEPLPREGPVTEWYKGKTRREIRRQIATEMCRRVSGVVQPFSSMFALRSGNLDPGT